MFETCVYTLSRTSHLMKLILVPGLVRTFYWLKVSFKMISHSYFTSHHVCLTMTILRIVTSQSFNKASFQQETVLYSQFLGNFNVFMGDMKKLFKNCVAIKILRTQQTMNNDHFFKDFQQSFILMLSCLCV